MVHSERVADGLYDMSDRGFGNALRPPGMIGVMPTSTRGGAAFTSKGAESTKALARFRIKVSRVVVC